MKHVLARLDLHQLPTMTTRGIRHGEEEGREHYYVSRETFLDMIDNGELLEHQVIHGNLYGMPVYVADSLTEDEEIAFNAGSRTELVRLAYRDFERLVQPEVMRFAVNA